MQHCFTKYCFSPKVIIPKEATPGTQDGKGNGEAGGCFEKLFFGFTLIAEWDSPQDAMDLDQRMWFIGRLLAKLPTGEHHLLGMDHKAFAESALRPSLQISKQSVKFRRHCGRTRYTPSSLLLQRSVRPNRQGRSDGG
jgi:hypothetical protein